MVALFKLASGSLQLVESVGESRGVKTTVGRRAIAETMSSCNLHRFIQI